MSEKTVSRRGVVNQSLNGQWVARARERGIEVAASVPGDIYRDLLEAKQIPDPFYRDNEKQCLWIGRTDWSFSRDFTVDQAMLDRGRVLLKCQGLDTLGTITINGQRVEVTDNMFRTWEFDVKKLLMPGKNKIDVSFASPKKYIEAKGREKWLYGSTFNMGHLRKEHCNFGWDWGPDTTTCGIWRDIELIGFDTARLSALAIRQKHEPGRKVTLGVMVSVDRLVRTKLTVDVKVSFHGKAVASATAIVAGKSVELSLTISAPKFWWPNGLGEQPLYNVTVDLHDGNGRLIDQQSRRIGLRTLVLDRHEDEWGESFQFVVNGVPFFAKGANWIPNDAILARMTDGIYRDRLQAAADVNMNMIRVWGGGVYEKDVFYDICDELGICVWQEFMFGCSTYPVRDKAFMKTVKVEAIQNVQRLDHHPCIALWCGNNELEMFNKTTTGQMYGWEGYGSLFDVLLADVVKEHAPACSYWPSSPHTPHGDRANPRNPACGDAHLWGVWHEAQPIESYRNDMHRFKSEFGFQSFPVPRTVHAFTNPDDRNVTSSVMDHHQRNHNGSKPFFHYMADWFRMPQGFDNTLWLSQILQGVAMKCGVESWRRDMPRCMGALYWQLNDNWPGTTWSSIDYHGRWKALHFMARKFFAPVLVSGLEDRKKGTVEIHVTSDCLKSRQMAFSWVVTNLAGEVLLEGGKRLRSPINGNKRVKTLSLSRLIGQQSESNLIVWLEMQAEGQPLQRNMVLFCHPKQLDLAKDPGIRYELEENGDGSFAVKIRSRHTALWAWLEIDGMDAEFSDNFFNLRPGVEERIMVAPFRKMSELELKQKLTIRSLVNTYA